MENAMRKRNLIAALIIKEVIDGDEEEEFILTKYAKICQRKRVSDVFSNRRNEGMFCSLIQNHLLGDEEKFQRYFRLTRERFFFILNIINDDLTTSCYNRVKEPITPAEKLAVTLRFLATGESYRSLAFGYRISPSAICTIVPTVLAALQKKLVPLFLPPADQIDWEQKANEFWKRWGFPNCVAAIDGKHVRIVAPGQSGSLYFNYKGYFSVVLLAMVDANCKFVLVDVGSYGKEGDAGIFKKSKMGTLVTNGTIFPPPKNLPHSDILVPHVVVGDDAFSLSKHMMKPYSRAQILQDANKRTYNYCHSKARRTSENAFGIMSQIFRIFFTPIHLRPETVESLIVVCCCLHNMLRDEYLSNSNLNAEGTLEDFPSRNLIHLTGTGGFAQAEGFTVRSRFTDYFTTHRNISCKHV